MNKSGQYRGGAATARGKVTLKTANHTISREPIIANA
jgi:hypothetical protein